MKHFLCIVSIVVLLSTALPGQNTAAVKSVKDKVLVIDKGWAQGVEKGMTGKAQRVVEESTGGETIPITVGLFVVRRVERNQSELYLEKLATGADPTMSVQVEFDEALISASQRSARLRRNKSRIIDHIKNNRLASAGELLEESVKLKKNDKEVQLLKDGLELLLADEMSITGYIDFKSRNPHRDVLTAAADKLKKTYPHLPPGKYLDASLPIAKNEKGYYEITFTDRNNHVMIYIPDKNFFIDKFEVANSRYLFFAQNQGIEVKEITFSLAALDNYPLCCPGYPAIVSYEEAGNYCRHYKMRLPLEAEWEEIAGFTKGYEYAWGEEEVDEAGVYRANFESMEDGFLEAAPVDSFARYSSPYGLVNMMGNVSEWVNGKYTKGGGFLSGKQELKITAKSTEPVHPGFRCVMEVKK